MCTVHKFYRANRPDRGRPEEGDRMKKIILLVLAISTAAFFASCGASSGSRKGETETGVTSSPVSTAEPETESPDVTEEPAPTATPAARKLVNAVSEKTVTADYSEKSETVGDPAAIVDGDETTRWSGFDLGRPNWAKNLHHEITIDLGGRYELRDFYIIWETLTGFYSIQVSEDGTDWTTVYEYDDVMMKATPLIDEGVFPKATFATMIRIVTGFPEGEKCEQYPYCSIYEFEAYGYEADAE